MTQATFTIMINGIKTATVNGIADAVKQIDWTLKGESEGQSFELPQSTTIPDAVQDGFISLASLTAENLTAWIETHEDRMQAIKAHIQFVLDKQVSTAALSTAPLPWMPVVDPALEPTAEPTAASL